MTRMEYAQPPVSGETLLSSWQLFFRVVDKLKDEERSAFIDTIQLLQMPSVVVNP